MCVLKSITTLLLIVLLAACQTAPQRSASGMPAAPSGFQWYTATNGAGSFLQPNGWFSKEEQQGNTAALFVTLENLAVNGRFETGMSVKRLQSFSAKQKGQASGFAREQASRLATTGKVLINRVMSGPGYQMYVVRVAGDRQGKLVTVHHMVLAADEADVLYMISMESPSASWDQHYPQMRMMLDLFYPNLKP